MSSDHPDHFPRIQVLWNRREALSRSEWEELYRRVMDVLAGYRPREAGALGDPLPDLCHQFFVERVMPGRGSNGPEHAGALRLYFRHFLLDLLRAAGTVGEPVDDNLQCEPGSAEAQRTALQRFGLSLDAARDAAAAFVATLSEDMLMLLRFCGCGDAAVSSFADRIASAHYRSGQLGLVHRRRSDKEGAGRQLASAAHRGTLIERWVMRTLGRGAAPAELDPGDAGDVGAAQALLDILCAVALAGQNPAAIDPTPA